MHNYEKNGKPSQLTGLWLDRWLQNYLAFMDADYRLSRWAPRFDNGLAQRRRQSLRRRLEDFGGLPGPAIFHVGSDSRPTPICRGHARHAWDGFKGPNIPPALANKVIARTAEAVRRIRARGGDVIFIRPPSAPQLRVNEQKRIPRELGWDRLLIGANAKGIHADDLPQAQNLVLPEWSHLSHKCATVFTDAYVRRLVELTARLKLRPNGPPALDRRDCVLAAQAGLTSSAASRATL